MAILNRSVVLQEVESDSVVKSTDQIKHGEKTDRKRKKKKISKRLKLEKVEDIGQMLTATLVVGIKESDSCVLSEVTWFRILYMIDKTGDSNRSEPVSL